MLKVFEAFAGYGSQAMALHRLKENFPSFDYEVVGISEIDKYALQAYEAVHGHCPNYGDISKIDWTSVPDFGLFTYSFPCQDISNAGRQKGFAEGAETRSSLLWECRRVIEQKRPKYLVMENVKNLVSKKFMPELHKWIAELDAFGYTNYMQVLDASDYGVPQSRKRVFLVSILGDNQGYIFPQPLPLKMQMADLLDDEVNAKYYLSEQLSTFNNIRGKSRIKQVGQLYDDADRAFKNPQCGRVYAPDGLSPTINTCGGGRRVPKILLAHNVIRELTPRECFRLMGVHDGDIDKIQNAGISKTQCYKLAGNSIVVDVLYYLLKNLLIIKL